MEPTPTSTQAEQLNDLLTYLHDSYNGYKECADVIESVAMKPKLENAAQKRAEMIKALEGAITKLGKEPVHSGSMVGPLHRLYVDLKALFTAGDEDAILNEIKRGENTLLNTYKEVLRNEQLSNDLKPLLEQEMQQIQEDIKELDQASV